VAARKDGQTLRVGETENHAGPISLEIPVFDSWNPQLILMFFEIIIIAAMNRYQKAAVVWGNIQRERAEQKYYDAPNICKFCGEVIKILPNQKVSDVRKKEFCNRNCFGNYNKSFHSNNCIYCGKDFRTRVRNNAHQALCKNNPNKIKAHHLCWSDERRKKHSIIMKEKNTNAIRIYTEVERNNRRICTIKHNAVYWTPEHKQAQSKKMCQIVAQHPESYSSKNVCGRTKGIPFVDSYGNHVILNGKWELYVAEYLNDNNIKWTKKIDAFPYFWNDCWHLYFPDFLLIDSGKYIEVKGFERDRDRCKWQYFPHTLVILKQKEIKQIKDKVFNINNITNESS
jgi:hypothetical protein